MLLIRCICCLVTPPPRQKSPTIQLRYRMSLKASNDAERTTSTKNVSLAMLEFFWENPFFRSTLRAQQLLIYLYSTHAIDRVGTVLAWYKYSRSNRYIQYEVQQVSGGRASIRATTAGLTLGSNEHTTLGV